MAWGIVLVEPPLTTAPLLWPLLSHLLPEPFQNIKVILLIDGLTLRNPYSVNEPLGVKERNDHGLLLRPAHLCLLGPGGGRVLPLGTDVCAQGREHPTLVASHYLI